MAIGTSMLRRASQGTQAQEVAYDAAGGRESNCDQQELHVDLRGAEGCELQNASASNPDVLNTRCLAGKNGTYPNAFYNFTLSNGNPKGNEKISNETTATCLNLFENLLGNMVQGRRKKIWQDTGGEQVLMAHHASIDNKLWETALPVFIPHCLSQLKRVSHGCKRTWKLTKSLQNGHGDCGIDVTWFCCPGRYPYYCDEPRMAVKNRNASTISRFNSKTPKAKS